MHADWRSTSPGPRARLLHTEDDKGAKIESSSDGTSLLADSGAGNSRTMSLSPHSRLARFENDKSMVSRLEFEDDTDKPSVPEADSSQRPPSINNLNKFTLRAAGKLRNNLKQQRVRESDGKRIENETVSFLE